MSMDLDEILQVFFEETEDHLTTLDKMLSALRPSTTTEQNVNSILRAAHSIKGNSATCGLTSVSKIAHEMESLLDVVRQRQGVLTVGAIKLLLEGKDQLSAQLQAYREGMEFDEVAVQKICLQLNSSKKSLPAWGTVVPDVESNPTASYIDPSEPRVKYPSMTPKAKLEAMLQNNERTLQLMFVLNVSNFPVDHVFQALSEFGEYCVMGTRTPKDQPYGQRNVLFHVNLVTSAPEAEIRDTLSFVVDDENSILIDVIQGPNAEDFGLFDIVFEDEVFEVALGNPVPSDSIEANEKTSNISYNTEKVATPLPTTEPTFNLSPLPSLDEDDPWGMDALAKPEEKLKALPLDFQVTTSERPIEKQVAASLPVPSAIQDLSKTLDDATARNNSDALLQELETLSFDIPVLKIETLQVIATNKAEVKATTFKVQTSEPNKDTLIAGSTSVLDHPLSNSAYIATPVVLPTNIKTFAPAPAQGMNATARKFQRSEDRREAAADALSLRVNLHKVEQVVDLVGELVIAQNQLQQNTMGLDPVLHSTLFDSMQSVVEHTRALQESVLSIRMTPMSTVFNRFYRMVRELNSKLGKNVVMKTMGENTEMDKILVEKLVDPLAHIIRNAMDHGIERPADRISAGKPEQGYILLRAFHRANSVIIEVLDDGRGMHRDKILQKAEEKGLLTRDPSDMSDAEVWNLVFEPGFSTAEKVTDVSGRGVGMDVVRQNIQELNGRIDIFSAYGKGMKITLTLPLTLSIMEGMFIDVAGESFVIPMSNLIQTLTPDPKIIHTLKGFGTVIQLGNQHIPLVSLHELFGIEASDRSYTKGVWIVLESGDHKLVVWVDHLDGQQQVVLKSLERNYKKSAGVFGATIRNDGSVALIIEPADVIAMVAHEQGNQWPYNHEGAA